mmetsp:Transcript_41563/g.65908  ORF Transcript_41563/g.65908 Transcript_41563/m.65908 type:complete len:310 (+) Transcript_41563:603-1532(+)
MRRRHPAGSSTRTSLLLQHRHVVTGAATLPCHGRRHGRCRRGPLGRRRRHRGPRGAGRARAARAARGRGGGGLGREVRFGGLQLVHVADQPLLKGLSLFFIILFFSRSGLLGLSLRTSGLTLRASLARGVGPSPVFAVLLGLLLLSVGLNADQQHRVLVVLIHDGIQIGRLDIGRRKRGNFQELGLGVAKPLSALGITFQHLQQGIATVLGFLFTGITLSSFLLLMLAFGSSFAFRLIIFPSASLALGARLAALAFSALEIDLFIFLLSARGSFLHPRAMTALTTTPRRHGHDTTAQVGLKPGESTIEP